ncbi:Zn-dependent hydrolase [Acrocarpospora corrugata]|uniref:Zn-dependent hydrolase n=1 Tax=Acrocarpospora corrugata TaxID=35763 RepID=A0A5M3VYP5_9ACTN|nr:allantoate amidohydrolase [Acrocarpospora corrugata]GES01925.1 Zn-dependent hydrolase [Acrocarpospora corrugata]
MLDVLAGIGRNVRTGGYRRDAWSSSELELREWFGQEADARGLDRYEDRNGNLWAWWGDPDRTPGVVTGSHLDSVREGGAFDGPLGVVSAFQAVDVLRGRGFEPGRPIGIVSFSDEEGARFGVPCIGSRLLTGILPPERARGLTGDDGGTLAEVLRAQGRDSVGLGRDEKALARMKVFVELHIEQGRNLTEPVGVAAAIWPHGRWRFDFRGTADHAGTTALADRDDPMLSYAHAVLAARRVAEQFGVVATFGKVRVSPNNANAIPSLVSAWLDARGPDEGAVRRLVAELSEGQEVVCESWTPEVTFPTALRDRLAATIGGPAPILPTGAGHDAGILASAGIPSAMLFVRNPTGVSHSPAEFAEPDDCAAGVTALADVLADLCGDAR